MKKSQRKQIEELLFQVYDKGVQQQDCNLTDYYEKIQKALNKPAVSKCVDVEREALLIDFMKHLEKLDIIEWTYDREETSRNYLKSINNC